MGLIGFETNEKAIFGNALGGLFFQFLIRFKGVIILPLIVHYLSKETIADWRIITTTVSVLLPLLTLNILDGSGLYFASDFDKKSIEKKYSSIINLSFVLLLFSIIPLFIKIKHDPELAELLILIISTLFVNYIFKIAVFIPQVYQKTKKLLIVNFISEYLSAAITYYLLYNNWSNIYTLVIPIFTINIIVSIWLFILLLKEIKFRLFYIDFEFIKKTLKISLPLIPVFFTEWIISSFCIYILEYYHGKKIVGEFSIALSISTLILTLKATLQYFWFSTCSNLIVNNNIEKFNNFYLVISKVFLFGILLCFIFYSFFSNDLILLLSSKEYSSMNIPINILNFGFGFMILATMLNGILYALSKTKVILYINIITAFISILIAYLTIPSYGVIGASACILISNLILYLGMLILIKKQINLPKLNIFPLLFFSFLFITIGFYSFYNFEPLINTGIGILILTIFTIIGLKLEFLPKKLKNII